MAKRYRTIRFITTTETLTIDIPLENEQVTRNEIVSEFQSTSGKRYKRITGSNIDFTYEFDLCSKEVFDFFNTAYLADSLTFEREKDDLFFDSYSVYLRKPQYREESVGEDSEKIYRDLTVEVLTA